MNTLFKSKFVTLIKTFNEAELKSFDLWLKSPWCNTNKNLVKLLEKLKRHYPDFDNEKFTKEKLFKQVLPKGKYSDRRINNLLSEGFQAAEKFMIFQNLDKNENLQKDLLTQELQNRHLEEWFFKEADREIARLEAIKIKEWEEHLDLFRLCRRVYHHPTLAKRMKPNIKHIVKMGEQLDLIYFLEKATIINEKIFRNRFFKGEKHDIEEELKNWKLETKEVKHLALSFYRRRFNYTKENMVEEYFKLRTDFLEQFEEFNKKEQKVHLVCLLNDTTLLIKKTLLDITEALPLYKLGLKTEILLHKGKITFNTFVIIISASNTKKSFNFTSKFIAEYSSKLLNQYQADALNWANAHTAYWKGNLGECLDILLKYEFQEFFFQRIVKVLTTQVYFDLYLNDSSYEDFLFCFFASFEKWLIRGKIPSNINRKPYLRFIQVCRLLAKNYEDVNFNLEKIDRLLEKEKNIQAHNWLKSKVKEVIKLKT